MLTPTNLSRLAAWAGITPETHPDIFMEPFIYHDVSSFASIEWCPLDAPNLPDPTDPSADAREVDRVWLADLMWTLQENDCNPDLVARYFGAEGGEKFAADCCTSHTRVEFHKNDCATLSLLLAARTAGVPEVVECMGDDSNG